MHVTIEGLTNNALERCMEDLKPTAWFKAMGNDGNGNEVILNEGVIIKTHTDCVTMGCAGHVAIIDEDEFVEIKIM